MCSYRIGVEGRISAPIAFVASWATGMVATYPLIGVFIPPYKPPVAVAVYLAFVA